MHKLIIKKWTIFFLLNFKRTIFKLLRAFFAFHSFSLNWNFSFIAFFILKSLHFVWFKRLKNFWSDNIYFTNKISFSIWEKQKRKTRFLVKNECGVGWGKINWFSLGHTMEVSIRYNFNPMKKKNKFLFH